MTVEIEEPSGVVVVVQEAPAQIIKVVSEGPQGPLGNINDSPLTGLNIGAATPITASDTTLSALGKLQAQATAAVARANHTGTQLAATISDFAASVRATVLTGIDFGTSAAITAADSILQAMGKLQAQITSLAGSVDGKQAADADLTAIAALSPSNDDVLQRKSGSWINRTIAQLKADLSLTKADVGLANADNTSDANKPVSTAQAAAIAAATGVWPALKMNGQQFLRISGHNLAIGDNDLYTVPAGKRLLIIAMNGYNSSAGNVLWNVKAKIGGTYYNVSSVAVPVSTGQGTNNNNQFGYVFEAGEVVSVNIATTSGFNIWIEAILFDDSSALRSVKLTSLAAGDNTLYTVPSGKCALIISGAVPAGSVGALNYVNNSGATRTLNFYAVSSGASIGTDYKTNGTQTVTNNQRNNHAVPGSLGSGDFIAVNVDSGAATQWCWLNVLELPNP